MSHLIKYHSQGIKRFIYEPKFNKSMNLLKKALLGLGIVAACGGSPEKTLTPDSEIPVIDASAMVHKDSLLGALGTNRVNLYHGYEIGSTRISYLMPSTGDNYEELFGLQPRLLGPDLTKRIEDAQRNLTAYYPDLQRVGNLDVEVIPRNVHSENGNVLMTTYGKKIGSRITITPKGYRKNNENDNSLLSHELFHAAINLTLPGVLDEEPFAYTLENAVSTYGVDSDPRIGNSFFPFALALSRGAETIEEVEEFLRSDEARRIARNGLNLHLNNPSEYDAIRIATGIGGSALYRSALNGTPYQDDAEKEAQGLLSAIVAKKIGESDNNNPNAERAIENDKLANTDKLLFRALRDSGRNRQEAAQGVITACGNPYYSTSTEEHRPLAEQFRKAKAIKNGYSQNPQYSHQ